MPLYQQKGRESNCSFFKLTGHSSTCWTPLCIGIVSQNVPTDQPLYFSFHGAKYLVIISTEADSLKHGLKKPLQTTYIHLIPLLKPVTAIARRVF